MENPSWWQNALSSVSAAGKGMLTGLVRGGIVGTLTALIANTVLPYITGADGPLISWQVGAMFFGVSDALVTGATRGYSKFQALQHESALAVPARELRMQREHERSRGITATLAADMPPSYAPEYSRPNTEQLHATHDGMLEANRALQSIRP